VIVAEVAREVAVPVPGIDLASTLGPLAMLAGDPTVRITPGRFERATFTPDGPGLISVSWDGGSARVTTSGEGARWLWHDLAWSIVQQRVHRLDAAAQWRRLVLEVGTTLDGGLVAPPSPRTVARLGHPALHGLGIERQRAEYLAHAAAAATRRQPLVDEPWTSPCPCSPPSGGSGAGPPRRWRPSPGATRTRCSWGRRDPVDGDLAAGARSTR
jgi:hypothetical protein